MIHGKDGTYNKGCHCNDCKRAHRYAQAEYNGRTPEPENYNDDWLVINLPIAVMMRKAFTDEEAIASLAALP